MLLRIVKIIHALGTTSGVILNMLTFGEALKSIISKKIVISIKKVPLALTGSQYGVTSKNAG